MGEGSRCEGRVVKEREREEERSARNWSRVHWRGSEGAEQTKVPTAGQV